ncbi:MAG: tRNA1(Val) (adenine(37)-N6)-methyltransferase [Smithellaceae bacterium]|nr:tRNA1(Val) (adenine(37)-N6)-methyltransferase [Smithellaceae bacterium]
MDEVVGGEDETVDDLLGGRLKIIQKRRGYRFSLDALLLAHFVRLRKKDRVIDLGTGSGVIALILAERSDYPRIVGVDIQGELVDMALRSVAANDLSDRVKIVLGDVRQAETLFPSSSFDAAVFNPPYRRLRSGRLNPEPQKAGARHEVSGSLSDFLAAAVHLLDKRGRVFIIYPATRTATLITTMRKAGFEPKRLRMVHSHAAEAAEFVLAEGRKGAGEEVEIMAPLFIYGDDGGEYTQAMKEIFNDLSRCPP